MGVESASHGAKLAALRSAVVASVDVSQLSEDVTFQYLRYIDELTCTHMAILAAIATCFVELADCKSMDKVYACVHGLLGEQVDRLAFRAFLQDLDSRFLIRIGDIKDFEDYASTAAYMALESSEIRPLEVTTLGHSFLSFVRA